MRFIRDETIQPNGEKGEYTYLDAIPGVVVLAVEDDAIYMIREYKYPIHKWIWNLFTGGINPKEDPLEVAKKELYEEGKISANKWKNLGIFYFAPGIESTYNHIFLATDLEINKFEINGTGNEAIIKIKKIPYEKVKAMINNDEIETGLVLGTLMKYFVFLENNTQSQ